MGVAPFMLRAVLEQVAQYRMSGSAGLARGHGEI